MPPKLRDLDRELVDRLDRLIDILERRELGMGSKSLTIDRSINLDDPDDNNVPDYFSTGPERVEITNTEEFDRIDFGIIARTINIRSTDDIIISFDNPQNEGRRIKIRGGETPFTIGGAEGIDTAFLWIKQAASASQTPGVEIIAYR